ncbi:MAG TPA: lysine transporter LysE [Anaerolineae bacterium]|nr:lysine transporter LysE [Anaerolineae bacterium]
MAGLIAITVSWALVSLSGVMAPGPISAMSFSQGTQRGFHAGPLISAGHALTELILVAGLAVGLGQVLQQSLVAGLIGLLGGAFLLWMGVDLVRSAWRGGAMLNSQGGQGAARLGLVPAGALLSVSNPYWLLWWATVGAANMISFLKYGLLGLATFYLSHILMDFGWNSLLSLIGASGRQVLSERVYRGILAACGLFLMAFSVYFVIAGIGFLRG